MQPHTMPSVAICSLLLSCTSGFSTRPALDDELVSHHVGFVIEAPRDAFVAAFLKEPLMTFLPGTASLPGVMRVEPLVDAFPAIGSVRRVVLRDGNTAREEVLECTAARLRYLVNEYSSPEAAPVAYAIGEFTFEPLDAKRTQVNWTYSFHLNGTKLPGALGAPGIWIFRRAFLEAVYVDYMAAAVVAMKGFAQSTFAPASQP